MAIKTFFLLLGFFLSSPVFAATYYVDNTVATCADYRITERDCGSGAEQNYATLAEVNAVLTAGDIAYIRGGTESYQVYNVTAASGAGEGIQPDYSGTSYAAMITYSTYNDEKVHLQGNTDTESVYSVGIYISEKEYIKVTGSATNKLKVSKCFQNVVLGVKALGTYPTDNTRYNEIAYVWATDSYLSGYALGTFIGNAVYKKANYNWIHHCLFERHGFSTAGDLFAVGVSVASTNSDTSNDYYNIIENNEFRYAGHSALFPAGMYNVYRNNYIHNEAWLTGPPDYGFRNTINHGYYTNHGNNLFEGNRIGHAGRTETDATGSTGAAWANSNDILRYNSFFNNGADAIEFRAALYAENYAVRSNGNYLYNNTFYYNGSNETSAANSEVVQFLYYNTTIDLISGIAIKWQAAQDNKIKNNLFYDNFSNQEGESVYGFGSAYTDYATAIACPSSQTQGCNVIENNMNDGAGENVNPLFTDTTLDSYSSWTLPNLSLQTGSPAIDAASYLTQANGAGEATTTLIVDDAKYFQDGKFGSASGCDPTKWASGVSVAADYIAIGTVTNYVQISEINYATNTITLASAKTWADDASIWLYKNSSGDQVLFGAAPDAGANEFEGTTATVTGTAISAGITETEVVAGGKTIIITLTGGDTWDADVGDDSAETTALIAGMDSNLAEAAGWDAVVKAALTHAAIVRTSDTVVTITLPAYAGYDITQSETITITIPTTCLSSATQVVASPTVVVSVVGQTLTPSGAQISSGAGGAQISTGAAGWILK